MQKNLRKFFEDEIIRVLDFLCNPNLWRYQNRILLILAFSKNDLKSIFLVDKMCSTASFEKWKQKYAFWKFLNSFPQVFQREQL